MKFYFWASLNDFNNWHEKVKNYLGLPKAGINAATGVVDDNAQMTTDYTNIVQFDDKWIAAIEESIAEQITDGIGIELTDAEISELTDDSQARLA